MIFFLNIKCTWRVKFLRACSRDLSIKTWFCFTVNMFALKEIKDCLRFSSCQEFDSIAPLLFSKLVDVTGLRLFASLYFQFYSANCDWLSSTSAFPHVPQNWEKIIRNLYFFHPKNRNQKLRSTSRYIVSSRDTLEAKKLSATFPRRLLQNTKQINLWTEAGLNEPWKTFSESGRRTLISLWFLVEPSGRHFSALEVLTIHTFILNVSVFPCVTKLPTTGRFLNSRLR